MTPDADVQIRPVADADEQGWKLLYAAYRDFYLLIPDDAVVDRVWQWLTDAVIELNGLVAERDGVLVGLANHRPFFRPSSGTTGIYLDDLFVHPDSRGSGVGRALLRRLADDAGEGGHSVVRWITAEDNRVARALYDSVATATHWVTYDLAPRGR